MSLTNFVLCDYILENLHSLDKGLYVILIKVQVHNKM